MKHILPHLQALLHFLECWWVSFSEARVVRVLWLLLLCLLIETRCLGALVVGVSISWFRWLRGTLEIIAKGWSSGSSASKIVNKILLWKSIFDTHVEQTPWCFGRKSSTELFSMRWTWRSVALHAARAFRWMGCRDCLNKSGSRRRAQSRPRVIYFAEELIHKFVSCLIWQPFQKNLIDLSFCNLESIVPCVGTLSQQVHFESV